ncbi:MAG: DUF817 domain-containing protein [Methylobacillus sp.]|jgi:uncharacterized membrane protein YoaT (DUF817 family)|nr:DUF817 domain-containing protein [Methylobacillus sp.]
MLRVASGSVHTSAVLHEFARFGGKQVRACLFGIVMLTLMLVTHRAYPDWMPLYRYDFLFLAALAAQAVLLACRMETPEEARVIALYHVIGTVMELFKTGAGSWVYPEPSVFHIGGVPLFSGFMYSCVGSYLCRVWRLFDFKFTGHPAQSSLAILSALIYCNFFAHHWLPDIRLALFALTIALFLRTRVHFRVWRVYRSAPLLPGFALIALLIWIAENIGTYSRAWIYPSQMHGWEPVSLAKMGSWFLLMIISYALVAMMNKPATHSAHNQRIVSP